MFTRRSFLKASSVVALSATVPLFLQRAAAAPDNDARVLVVVEMDGGNDALNTVIPHADAEYAKLRPRLKVDPKRVIKVTDGVGLHPALKPLDKLLAAGQLAVLPGVGYPNPNRSHFESMAMWHTARFDEAELRGYGWLGRAMDPSAGNLFAVGGDVPTALRGRRSSAVAFKRIEEVLLTDPAAAKASRGTDTADDLLAYVRRQAADAHAAADKLAALTKDKGGPTYPQSELAQRLKMAAKLLKADVGARVFYTSQGSYDTHSQQTFTHAELLADFAAAVAAFFNDLKDSKLADRVTLLSFSEFGRTIQENGSAGTDHGTAGACFMAGPTVAGGLVGSMPSLTDLEKGEPKMTTDFRRIYHGVLTDWMSLPADDGAKGLDKLKVFA
jgi:uncharacterized protein (DUF1501 family)